MQVMEIITMGIFVVALLWVGYDFIKCRKTVTIYCKNKSKTVNILLGVLVALSIVSIIFDPNVMNVIRCVMLGVLIILYINLGDGVGPTGVYSMNRTITNDEIMAYDFEEKDDEFLLYVSFISNKNLKKGTTSAETASIVFDRSKRDDIKAILTTSMPKKHKRVKRQ